MTTLNPMNLTNYTEDHLREQIMALIGRSQPDPRAYRAVLDKLALPDLSWLMGAILNDLDEAMTQKGTP